MKSKRFIVVGVLLIVFVVLVGIASSSGFVELIIKYRTVFSDELKLIDILTFNFPPTGISTGAFGLFFSYWIISLFGNYFYIILLLSLFSVGVSFVLRSALILRKTIYIFLSLFFFYLIILQFNWIKGNMGYFPQIASNALNSSFISLFGVYFYLIFLIFVFLLVLFIYLKNKLLIEKIIILFLTLLSAYLFIIQFNWLSPPNGNIPQFFSTKLNQIFDSTGTKIVTVLATILGIIIFLELEKINNFILNLWLFLGKVWKSIIKIFSFKSHLQIVAGKLKRKKDEEKEFIQEKNTFTELETKDDKDYEKPISNKINKTEVVKNRIPPLLEESGFILPKIEDFLVSRKVINKQKETEQKENISKISKILQEKLMEFGVEAQVVKVNVGPVITQYELEPSPGVKVSKFSSLQDDLALAIKAKSIRIISPIPGKGRIGIEIPNKYRDIIYFKDVIQAKYSSKQKLILPLALGKNIVGEPVVADLATMPHLLIAGATGSGKSVCVNTIINSILFYAYPENIRLIMIDPKRIELSGYEGIPHLIQEVVTSPDDALKVLNWAVFEMERRYKLLQKYRVRDIIGYNQKAIKNKTNESEDTVLPYIILLIDEFADLIMTAGKDIENPITRLAQMARAIGIHLILATQRPSTKIITGIIKANFPSRIAFQVSSKIDSRVILDINGAEKLLGMGDMLFLSTGKALPERIHGAFISDSEIESLIEYLKTQPKPEYQIDIFGDNENQMVPYEFDDELFPEAAVYIVAAGTASVSMLQRHFKIGYARAGRLIDMLQEARIIGPHLGSKSREVLATEEDMKIYGYLKDNA